MRTIKFRQFIDGQYWYWGYGVNSDPEEFVPPKDPSKPSEQYTGLDDRHGIKVYEGDVVKMHQFLFDGTEVEREHTGIVDYNEELTSFNFTHIKGKFYSEHTGFDEGQDKEGSPICMFHGLHEESFEIIGNIHENPNLLEES